MIRYYKGQTIYIKDTKKTEKGQYTFKDFLMKKEYENMNYDFTVKLASRSKADKNRQYNLIKDLYTIQNQYKEDKKVINVVDLVKAAQLDNYDEMFKRLSNMSEEAFAEKADMIVQIMGIGQTITPNGAPLITAEEMQQGILDVLDDNGDLSVVENIFKTYEDYQTQITQLKGQIAQQQQQQAIDNTNSQEQALIDQMQQGVQNMNQQAVEEQDLNNILSSIGL